MGTCNACGKESETRFGICFDCASSSEERVSKRSVLQHIRKGTSNLLKGNFEFAKYDFKWAWERFTKTGDYADGGTFDFEGYEWRRK